MIVFTNDKKRLRDHFEKDPVLFAYHLGDLDDFYFPHCQWASVYEERPYIVDCALVYTGLDKPTLLAFGLTERFGKLMTELVDLLPDKFHAHFQAGVLSVLESRYKFRSLGTHLKMSLGTFAPFTETRSDGDIVRLDDSHREQLAALYDVAYPDNYFSDKMLATGKYFGFVRDSQILCVAGVHVDAPEYRISALGNIATHPDWRGKALASLVTSHLVAELVSEGRRVCLNVKTDNPAAIKCYERLGFKTVHEYEEGYFERK